ncbi:DUF4846 domain-containing protein [Anaerocolumna sp. AGMB13020]|uniref:DUF4846 domain-containing protein n=1 Tax=Anaerocolumna sp. AGMB13020 TaxID=3081750 RepID=UPI0029558572|nr:DUF4846 domain-containing protein [Anaerocolumna sp. AGMB13020]WOO37764.1 DUF4846 domain-containing protein [Anaerocolumna sp. AGMB13020]
MRDYKKTIRFLLLTLFSILILTACTSDSSNEPSAELTEKTTTGDSTDNKVEPSVTVTPEAVPTEAVTAVTNTIPTEALTTQVPTEAIIVTEGTTILERFNVPDGYKRVEAEEDSFGFYLQNLSLKPDGTKVKYYDGREKRKEVYLAVVDFTLGDRDLQQCADGVIRLRAEYLYETEQFDRIHFNFVSGFKAEFSKWADGKGISVKDNNVSWYPNSKNNRSYESFQKYLDIVYAYASTLSLEKELIAKPYEELAIGDVFIQGGAPGHCVIVVDMAVKESTGEKIFMLAQSYMPAQDIQILKGDKENSPWFSAEIEGSLITPEWIFNTSDLKTW